MRPSSIVYPTVDLRGGDRSHRLLQRTRRLRFSIIGAAEPLADRHADRGIQDMPIISSFFGEPLAEEERAAVAADLREAARQLKKSA